MCNHDCPRSGRPRRRGGDFCPRVTRCRPPSAPIQLLPPAITGRWCALDSDSGCVKHLEVTCHSAVPIESLPHRQPSTARDGEMHQEKRSMLKAGMWPRRPVLSSRESRAPIYNPEPHAMGEPTDFWYEPADVHWASYAHVVPTCVVRWRPVSALPVPESSGLDAFSDVWGSPGDIELTPLDHGYGARLRDALRIRADFSRAIAILGLTEDRVGD